MEFRKTHIPDLIEIYPKIIGDSRGYFFESFSAKVFKDNGIDPNFVQDNQSYSTAGVLRGLHMQHEPYGQAKLVRVISGKVLDVVVDIRKASPTFGQHMTFVLDALRGNMVYVPAGFLHGFATLEDAVFSYKCSNYYNKSAEGGVYFADKDLKINWGIENPIVSEKDMQLPDFETFAKSLQ